MRFLAGFLFLLSALMFAPAIALCYWAVLGGNVTGDQGGGATILVFLAVAAATLGASILDGQNNPW